MYLLITLMIIMGTAKLDNLMSNSELTQLSNAQFAFVCITTMDERNYSLGLAWCKFKPPEEKKVTFCNVPLLSAATHQISRAPR